MAIVLSCKIYAKDENLESSKEKRNTQSFFYEMKKKDIEKLKEGVKNLSIGDDYNKIIKILGEPTFYYPIQGKKYNAPITGYQMSYYTKIFKKNLVNEIHDRYVLIILDKNHNLKKIILNISDIEERKKAE